MRTLSGFYCFLLSRVGGISCQMSSLNSLGYSTQVRYVVFSFLWTTLSCITAYVYSVAVSWCISWIPDPWSRDRKSTGSRIQVRNTVPVCVHVQCTVVRLCYRVLFFLWRIILTGWRFIIYVLLASVATFSQSIWPCWVICADVPASSTLVIDNAQLTDRNTYICQAIARDSQVFTNFKRFSKWDFQCFFKWALTK